MQFQSTRSTEQASLDQALVNGLAADGGLYVPVELPQFDVRDFAGANTLTDVARVLLTPFFQGSALLAELPAILAETFRFPIPLTPLPGKCDNAEILELYHGPTAAFKDVGAGFLAACLSRLQGDPAQPLTILVATSGDTGGAVAAAFDQRIGMRVVVLFPEGRVSERQAQQLTCWSDNVLSVSVKGSFDDCQKLVKQAMANVPLGAQFRFSSANSINIGRLLPQTTYYAYASLKHYRSTGRKPGFVIPTGNLGNAHACVMTRAMGLPIAAIVLATNANRTIPDYLESLEWRPRASIQTLATAMDVGDPSNMERLRGLLGDAAALRRQIDVYAVDDADIRAAIRTDFSEFGFATCPHTATATHVWRHMRPDLRSSTDWIIVATAHPAKFETVVEPLIGTHVGLPAELAAILSRPSRSVMIRPSLDALTEAMRERFIPG
ncbi:MAG: threonine synthase [Gammaproteobacteria bacterium]|nr:threonine synthase [Gammaproteobacteria bacterium]